MHKILLIDDSETILNALKTEINRSIANVEILLAYSYQEANKIIRQNQSKISAAVVDLNLQDSEPGKAVLLTSSHSIPTIILSGTDGEIIEHLMAKKNVLDYVHKTDLYSIKYAVTFIKRTIRNYEKTVLVVDDSKLFREAFKRDLEKLHINVIEAKDGKEAIDVMNSEDGKKISIVLTDYNMPNMDGIELTTEIRKKYQKDTVSIIAISATDDESALTKFIKAGVNDFITKPHKFEELNVRINSNLDLLDLFEEAKDLANKDFLTGAYNRRYFFETSSAIVAKNRRKDANIAVSTIDIDKFKNINDKYGHDIGDIAIKEVIKILKNNLRTSDLVARFGGEEFCVLLEDISLENAKSVFENIRHAFEINEIKVNDITLKYTVSTGVFFGKSDDIDEMLKISDEALYEAKENGRNRVVINSI